MQLKMGGKFHLKLNIGERPIANKYREGKMKSTLKRELKVLEIVEREAWRSVVSVRIQPVSGGVLRRRRVSISFGRRRKAGGRWHPRVCYSLLLHTLAETEECSSPLWPGFAHVRA